MNWRQAINGFDERRDIFVASSYQAAIQFSVEHFIAVANEAIEQHGFFAVALSGGSTPKVIYETLASKQNRSRIQWQNVRLFWSDERSVPPDHPDSNFHMAMTAGFDSLPIKPENIYRMPAEDEIEERAKEYDQLLKAKLHEQAFDLIMLGMGDDGHTASLFPKTHGLHPIDRLAIANYIPQKNTWRMTLTFQCINSARHIAFYVLGKSKADMAKHVLTGKYEPDLYPAQKVGTGTNKALWILDREAGALL